MVSHDPAAQFLFSIGVIILVSQLSSELFKRLRLPGLIGAIIGGMVIGPNVLNIVAGTQTISFIALLGVLLILFVLGVEFEAKTFWRVGRASFLLTTTGVIFTLILGYLTGIALGWTPTASFLLAVVLAPSGTSIAAAALTEVERSEGRLGSTIVTACIIDDVEGVILLTIALGLVYSEEASLTALTGIASASIAFVLLAIFLGSRVFPKVVVRMEKFLSDEAMFAIILSLGILLAFGATQLGLGAITGAFIMGSMVPTKRIGERFVNKLYLMKEIFAAIFFTTIGMSVDPSALTYLYLPIGAILFIALAGRLVGGLAGGLLSGLRGKEMWTAVVALIARAEMSLIVAEQGVEAGLVGVELITIAALVVILSILITTPAFVKMVREVQY